MRISAWISSTVGANCRLGFEAIAGLDLDVKRRRVEMKELQWKRFVSDFFNGLLQHCSVICLILRYGDCLKNVWLVSSHQLFSEIKKSGFWVGRLKVFLVLIATLKWPKCS